jgi:hypothetical protein
MWTIVALSVPAAFILQRWWVAAIGLAIGAFFAPATVGLTRTHRNGRLFQVAVDRIDTALVPSGLARCEVDLQFPQGVTKVRVLVSRAEAERFMNEVGGFEILVAVDPRAVDYAICPGLRPRQRARDEATNG